MSERQQRPTGRPIIHGHAKSSSLTYHSWNSMKGRCHCPTDDAYERYGARGITVCERWRNSFSAFLEDMGERPSSKHNIDRIDNDKGYEPGNCRWVTMKEQQNNRRNNVIIEFQGRKHPLDRWAAELGIPAACLRDRIQRQGWDVERALTTPVSREWRKGNGPYEFRGKSQSIAAWSRELGISTAILSSRLNSGWGVEAAFTTPPCIEPIEYQGRKQTLNEWAKELGFSRPGLKARLDRGLTVEQAFSMKRGSRTP